MTLTKQEINGLNRINSSAQKIGLGDILARIEKGVLETQAGSDTDLLQEELDEIREANIAFETLMTNFKTLTTNLEISMKNLAKENRDVINETKTIADKNSLSIDNIDQSLGKLDAKKLKNDTDIDKLQDLITKNSKAIDSVNDKLFRDLSL